MNRAAVVLLIAAAGCSSAKNEPLPATIPPPQVRPTAAPADPRVDQLQAQLTELLDRLDVLNARIAKLEAAQVSATPAPAPAPAPASSRAQAPGESASRGADIADDYRQAIILIGQGRYPDARAAFQRVFDLDPSGDLADNALFWIGETYYETGDYPNAMRYYERVEKEYAQQNKAPDAIFKLGLAYVKTGDLGMAQRAFQECIDKYPYSSPAAAARMELKKIKY